VEATLRKIHRTVGIYLALLLGIQAITGLFLALASLSGSEGLWYGLNAAVHHDWNPVGSAYRVLLGIFTAGQALGGVLIYRMMRARMKKS